jgi:hypothetical protein
VITLWREVYHLNPILTVYVTVSMVIFLTCLVLGARMMPEERFLPDVKDVNATRGDMIFGFGFFGGIFWGVAVLVVILMALWAVFVALVRVGKRPPRPRLTAQGVVDAHLATLAASREPNTMYFSATGQPVYLDDYGFPTDPPGTRAPEPDQYLLAAQKEVDDFVGGVG